MCVGGCCSLLCVVRSLVTGSREGHGFLTLAALWITMVFEQSCVMDIIHSFIRAASPIIRYRFAHFLGPVSKRWCIPFTWTCVTTRSPMNHCSNAGHANLAALTIVMKRRPACQHKVADKWIVLSQVASPQFVPFGRRRLAVGSTGKGLTA